MPKVVFVSSDGKRLEVQGKIGEIYTQFGEYAVVNDCEDCDDMEVKNLLKY